MMLRLPSGSDPFVFAAQANIITDYLTPDGDLLALRILNRAGQGAEAKPPQMDASINQEMTLAIEAASKGQPDVVEEPVSFEQIAMATLTRGVHW